MHNTLLMNPKNEFEKGYVTAFNEFEKAVEEFMIMVSTGNMPSEIDACDFFATKLHETFLKWR